MDEASAWCGPFKGATPMSSLIFGNLTSPVVLCFVLGIVATRVRSGCAVPEQVFHTLSIYLMLSIGLRGGAELAGGELRDLAVPLGLAFALGCLISLSTFIILHRAGKLTVADAAAMAAHYGSVSAVTFAADAGWVALANHYKVALVLPEQTSSNNHGRCFNWFLRDDLLQSDRKRIFVTGFSAGGGMAAALIAAYPAMFAAAAVFAGMPVGSASSAIGALLHMRKANTFRSRLMLAADVLQVTGIIARKRWPRVSIWHGDDDHTVDPANAEMLAAQWSALHGLAEEPSSDETISGVRRRLWGRIRQVPAVELCTLSNIGHGFPIDRRNGRGGRAGAWVTDAGPRFFD
eukprot:gene23950-25562_t